MNRGCQAVRICLELCMKDCALHLHPPIMTLSFTDLLRTNICERSTAGHGQSDTCLCPSLARFSPAVCIAVSSGHNSRIQHLNSALVRKNQVVGSFCSCPSSIHLTESDGYSLQSGTAIFTWIRRSNCFFLKSPLCPGILYLKRDFITMIFIYKDCWFEKWPK